jgi:hypothetical protein
MPIKKSGKIVRIVFAVILLLLLTQNACVRASWASHRIRRGMTVNKYSRSRASGLGATLIRSVRLPSRGSQFHLTPPPFT